MNWYGRLVRPLLFRLEPERSHRVVLAALKLLARCPRLRTTHGAGLKRTVFGIRFPNPIGLAAGFDKNATALPAWERLGFGFVEAGTVTARAQPGNPKPRVFRVPEHEALINRLGFNNDGADVISERLRHLRESGRRPAIPIGINIGKSKTTPVEEATEDYVYSFERLAPHADYVVLNVSSPNTPGLRTLQNSGALNELVSAVTAANAALRKPVLLKVAPDIEWAHVDEILEVATAHKLSGIVATNTTCDHSMLPESLRREGGLSGAPLSRRSTEVIGYISSRSDIPLIGVGGICDAASALEKFNAGASLIQLYTGLIYRGPVLIRQIAAHVNR